MTNRLTLAHRADLLVRRSPPRSLILALSLACACGTANRATAEQDAPPPSAGPYVTDVADASPGGRVAVTAAAVDDLQVAFKHAINRAGPAVVSIFSTKTVRVRLPHGPFGEELPLDELFNLPHGQGQEFTQRGLGSGFIFTTDGHIITNNHVVEGADDIRVKLADNREFMATLIGSDPPTDLAVLQIHADELEPVEFGDSDAVEVGDWILAIGDPYGLPQTVSVGIVSAKGRGNVGLMDFENFIQTDAAVNPGNSGGPIVNLAGRVIGISAAIASRGGGSEGVAFAIPSNMAKDVITQLMVDGKVTRGHLGVMISPLSDDLAASFGFAGEEGILVQDVVEDSAAARAGVRPGDIITSLNREAVEEVTQFRTAIASKQPGTRVTLGIWRAGQTLTLEVTLGEAPGADAPEPSGDPEAPPELGLTLEDIGPRHQRKYDLPHSAGVVITKIDPGSPAALADLQPGDVIEQIGDRLVVDAQQAERLLGEADLGEGVRLRVTREGVGRFVFIKAR